MAGYRIREVDWASSWDSLSAIRRAVFIDEQGVPENLEWDWRIGRVSGLCS